MPQRYPAADTSSSNPHTPRPITRSPAPSGRKIPHMPPVMSREESDKRAEQAWNMRVAGATWVSIAEKLGFANSQNCQNAVKSWLRRNPPEDFEFMRRATSDGIRLVRAAMLDSLGKARKAGAHRTVSELGRAVLDSFEKEAKLWGLHVVQPQVVDVRVASASQVLERAEQDFLALLGGGEQPLDVEVVDEVVE